MNKVTVQLDEFENRKVDFSFGYNYVPFIVRYKEDEIGQLHGGVPALESGAEFFTPDGNTIYVELDSTENPPILEVMFNQVPVPSSENYPAKKVKRASWWVFVFGLLFLIFGFSALAEDPYLLDHWTGYLVPGIGTMLLVCFFGIRKYFQLALWIPLVIVVLNLLAYVSMEKTNVVVLILNGLAIYSMIRAIRPINQMNLIKLRLRDKKSDDLLDSFG